MWKSLLLFALIGLTSYGQNNSWQRLSDFKGTSRAWAVGIQMYGDIYLGTGFDSSQLTKDFWRYNPDKDKWFSTTELAGAARDDAFYISDGSSNFIGAGIGEEDSSSRMQNDMYSFDAEMELWNILPSLPASGRLDPFVFYIDGILYVGGGRDSIRVGDFLNDFWKYDPQNQKWEELDTLPFAPRFRAMSFSQMKMGYVGGGQSSKGLEMDFWKFDTEAMKWTELENLPDTLRRVGMNSFQYEDNFFAGLGTNGRDWFNDFWKYDIQEGKWKSAGVFPGDVRAFSVSVLGEEGVYIGTGFNMSGYLKDWWRFVPEN